MRADANVTFMNQKNEEIRDLQKDWHEQEVLMKQAMKPFLQKQQELHDAADAARDEMCMAGSFSNCRTPELLQEAKTKYKATLKSFKVSVTSYNPKKAQTDASPCIGAAGVDICRFTLEGRPIALSQDLVGNAPWKPFRYHDTVFMESDIPQCNGQFVVLDTMNKRWDLKADIFNMYAEDNTSCVATIYRLEGVSREMSL